MLARARLFAALALAVLSVLCGGAWGANPYTLHLLPTQEEGGDALCLDGSPAGFYTHLAPPGGRNADKWILFFEGGGVCTTIADCYARSFTVVGSSKAWEPSINYGGLMSANAARNPQFFDWNKVFLRYCDGDSFTGTAPPVTYNKTQLHFTGAMTVERVLETLAQKYNLGSAREVMSSGASAGGMASMFTSLTVQDRLKELAPGVKKFKIVPLSGIFIDIPSWGGERVLRTMIQQAVATSRPRQHPRGGVDVCRAAYGAGSEWRCQFAEWWLPLMRAPVFAVNSVIDRWQLKCSLAGTIAGGCDSRSDAESDCVHTIAHCPRALWSKVRAFSNEFVARMPSTSTSTSSSSSALNTSAISEKISAAGVGAGQGWMDRLLAAVAAASAERLDLNNTSTSTSTSALPFGFGAYLNTCETHGEAVYDGLWNTVTSPTGKTMHDAVWEFWQVDMDRPQDIQSVMPCEFSDTPPYQCNPTCKRV